MSDTTLYVNLYQQINEHAELVDKVLIGLISKRSDSALLKKLGKLLVQLASPPEGYLGGRMISQMILESVGQSELEMAGQTLLMGEADEVSRETVERLAKALEQERAKAMSRILGERR